MGEFVYLFRSGEPAQREAMGTPERAQQSMQAWLAWLHELEANGHLKERGRPLERVGKVAGDRRSPVTDGPYIETKELIAGFMIVEARDPDEAVELSAGCPILAAGSVEVRPVMQLPFKPGS